MYFEVVADLQHGPIFLLMQLLHDFIFVSRWVTFVSELLCVLDVQLFWCFSVISRQYLRSLFLMYALFSRFLNSMWVN